MTSDISAEQENTRTRTQNHYILNMGFNQTHSVIIIIIIYQIKHIKYNTSLYCFSCGHQKVI